MRTNIATLAVVLLFVGITTQQTPLRRYCADLVIDDTRCEGHRANFPKKVCAFDLIARSNTSSYHCDDKEYYSIFKSWQNACPLQNFNTSQFCDGTGYLFVGFHSLPCFVLRGCNTDEDCNPVEPPRAPVPEFKPLCMECCLFCHNVSRCQQNSIYTNSSDCTPCSITPPTTSQSPVNQPQIDTPVGSIISHPNANNEEDSEGLKIAPWIYAVVAVAIVAPLILLFVLLFRHKCSKVAPRKYGKLEENTVNTIEMDD